MTTYLITFHPDETITLDSGGWRTVTTKDRLNTILPRPLGVYSDHGVWTVVRRGNNPGTVSEFYDGMTLTRDGDMITEVKVNTANEYRKVKRQIRSYVALYTDEKVSELIELAATEGTAGDCWFCAMVTSDGQSLGAATGDTGHLLSHLDEGYVMASLIRNALKFVGYQDRQIPVVARMGDIVRRSVRRYLTSVLTTSHGSRPEGRDSREGGFSNSVAS